MTAPRAVMIFAAGRGTRMGDLTSTRPKPLIEVAGRPLIDHALDFCAEIPVRVANTHHMPEALEEYLATRDVATRREAELLDTGGGLKAAAPALGEPVVATINSDAVWSGPNPLAMLADAWAPARMDALLALVPLSRTVGRRQGGDFEIDRSGRLGRGGNLVFTGAQMIALAVVEAVPDRVFSLNRVWDEAIAAGRLHGLAWPGRWADVGHPEGIAEAEAMLRGGDDV